MLDLFSQLFPCFSVSRFGSGDSAGVVQRARCSCTGGSLQDVGPAFYLLGGCLWEQRLVHKEFLHLLFHRSSWLLLAPLLSPPVPVVTAPPCSLCPEGAHRFQWIGNLVPEFGISSSRVKVLSSPTEFYELLKVSWGLQVFGAGSCGGCGESQTSR